MFLTTRGFGKIFFSLTIDEKIEVPSKVVGMEERKAWCNLGCEKRFKG